MNILNIRRCFIICVAFVLYHVATWDSDSFSFINLQNSLVQSSSLQLKLVDKIFPKSSEVNKVVIGTYFCRNENSIKLNKIYEQTLVMIKSVFISANLYNIGRIEIHLFLDHLKDEKYFREEIEQNLILPEGKEQHQIKVVLKIYSAVDPVPENYRAHLIYHDRFRCSFTPIFYEKSLPDVDSIIHLDSQTIITGNIGKLWELLGQMNDKQMISMGYNRQPENDKYEKLDAIEFKDIPHIAPKGVNTNVAVMNLTRMRKFGYLEKTLSLFENYSKKPKMLNDQQLANILFYNNPEILHILPCQMNFLSTDCQRGFFCKSALDDMDGLHVINGNSLRFMESQVFHPFYKFYSKFNVSDSNADHQKDLMQPIQHVFSNLTNRANNQCYGTVNKVVFRKFQSWLELLW